MGSIEDGQPERSWQLDAHCIGVNPEVFDEHFELNIPNAKSICAECVVKSECLNWALVTPQLEGWVCGGLTTAERAALL